MAPDNGNDGGGQDDGATVVAGPSFDEMLARRGESATGEDAATDEGPSWSQDMAFAATQMGQSYDEMLAEQGLPMPAGVPRAPAAPPPPAGHPQAPLPQPSVPNAPAPLSPSPFAPHPGTPGPIAPSPIAPSPFAPHPGTPSPVTPAPQHTPAPVPAPSAAAPGQPPLAATMALDMSQSPIFAPHLDPNAPAHTHGAAPMATPPGPGYGAAPQMGAPPMAVPAMAPPAGKSRVLLFVITFGAVFVLGSLCFGGAAVLLLL